jgi:hypothetical protein
MALAQFDLARILHCVAIDDEGFSCARAPGHDGDHHWDHCAEADRDGHRCGLQLRHPGRHEPPWYDRTSAPGASHAVVYGGTERQTEALADRMTLIAARYGWEARSRAFTPGLAWRIGFLRPVSANFRVNGRLTLEFERRSVDATNLS